MKRDMDLARKILLQIEESPYTMGKVQLDFGEEVQEKVVQYHLLLLQEAGLIEAIDASSFDGPAFLPTRLTWQGHEFLDASRDETIWNSAKKTVLEKTGGLAFDVLLALLKELARSTVFGT